MVEFDAELLFNRSVSALGFGTKGVEVPTFDGPAPSYGVDHSCGDGCCTGCLAIADQMHALAELLQSPSEESAGESRADDEIVGCCCL